jgi:hypothetical protein
MYRDRYKINISSQSLIHSGWSTLFLWNKESVEIFLTHVCTNALNLYRIYRVYLDPSSCLYFPSVVFLPLRYYHHRPCTQRPGSADVQCCHSRPISSRPRPSGGKLRPTRATPVGLPKPNSSVPRRITLVLRRRCWTTTGYQFRARSSHIR